MATAPILTNTDSFWSLVLASAAEDAKSGPGKSVCNSLGHVSRLQVKLYKESGFSSSIMIGKFLSNNLGISYTRKGH